MTSNNTVINDLDVLERSLFSNSDNILGVPDYCPPLPENLGPLTFDNFLAEFDPASTVDDPSVIIL